jgi:hypothetical protein
MLKNPVFYGIFRRSLAGVNHGYRMADARFDAR